MLRAALSPPWFHLDIDWIEIRQQGTCSAGAPSTELPAPEDPILLRILNCQPARLSQG